jgi:hypothetical protein
MRLRPTCAAFSVCITLLALPVCASAYQSRPASNSEVAAIVGSAKVTHVCGYDGQRRQLSRVRVVAYRARAVVFKWAATVWKPPGGQECVLVFLHASSVKYFIATKPLHHAKVAWLPFTWGSSPFDDSQYLNREWKHLQFAAKHPDWLALNRALVFPLF